MEAFLQKFASTPLEPNDCLPVRPSLSDHSLSRQISELSNSIVSLKEEMRPLKEASAFQLIILDTFTAFQNSIGNPDMHSQRAPNLKRALK